MARLTDLLVLGGLGYLIWKNQKGKSASGVPIQQLPAGSVPTGKVQRTTSGGPPGSETVGYAIRDWAEVIMPSGLKQWVEVQLGEAKK